jgi:putative ABC transport system ATP-binding protein
MLIAINNVSKIYPMGSVEVRALEGVSLCIERGAFVSIMGRSGSGKTTLLDVMGCLSRPTSGEYLLNGQSVHALSDEQMAAVRNKSIGFIFQTFHLLPRQTALMNVALPLFYNGVAQDERHQRAKEALQQVELGHRTHHLPRELSGGQQQRVAIARALVNRPAVVLADEPTGNLDSKSGAEIIDLLKALHRQGQTIILVTHDIGIARQAERRIVLEDGVIVEDVEER